MSTNTPSATKALSGYAPFCEACQALDDAQAQLGTYQQALKDAEADVARLEASPDPDDVDRLGTAAAEVEKARRRVKLGENAVQAATSQRRAARLDAERLVTASYRQDADQLLDRFNAAAEEILAVQGELDELKAAWKEALKPAPQSGIEATLNVNLPVQVVRGLERWQLAEYEKEQWRARGRKRDELRLKHKADFAKTRGATVVQG